MFRTPPPVPSSSLTAAATRRQPGEAGRLGAKGAPGTPFNLFSGSRRLSSVRDDDTPASSTLAITTATSDTEELLGSPDLTLPSTSEPSSSQPLHNNNRHNNTHTNTSKRRRTSNIITPDDEHTLQLQTVLNDEDDDKTMQLGADETTIQLFKRREDPRVDDDEMVCSYRSRNMLKSEVLRALDEFKHKSEALEKDVDTLRAKLAACKEENMKLVERASQHAAALKAAEAREKAVYEWRANDAQKSEKALRKEVERCAELQSRLAQAAKTKAEAEARAVDEAAKRAAAEAELRAKQHEANARIQQLEHALRAAKEDASINAAALREDAAVEMQKARAASEQAESIKQTVNHMRQDLRAAEERAITSETAAAALDERISNLQAECGRNASAVEAAKKLREELSSNYVAIAEARRVLKQRQSVALLEEKLAAAEREVSSKNAALQEMEELRSHNTNLQQQVDSWQELLHAVPGVTVAADVPRVLGELQKEAMLASSKQGEAVAHVAALESSLAAAERSLKAAQSQTNDKQAELNTNHSHIRRLELKVQVLQNERDGLRQLLDTYDAEERLRGGDDGRVTGAPMHASPAIDKERRARVARLEEALAAAEKAARDTEASLRAVETIAADRKRECDGVRRQLEDVLAGNSRLEKEVTSLGKQVALLESRVGRGDFNPGTTKVLHLSRNPEKDTAAQSELEQLRARVQQLEAQLAGTDESGAGGSAAGLQKRVDELEKKVKDMDKQKARYMQVFSDKITSFREACWLLFGYTMEMGDRVVTRGNIGGGGGAFVNTFTLRSIYAEGSHETLMFQGSPGKALELVPTDYSQRPEVMRQVATFINRCNSIPAFTANLTVELFSKYTIS